MSTTHQLVLGGVDSGVADDVSKDEWNDDHNMSPFPVLSHHCGNTFLNTTPLFAVSFLFGTEAHVDLTRATRAYISAGVGGNGASLPKIIAMFDAWDDVAQAYEDNWFPLDSVNGPFVTIGNVNTVVSGAEVTIDPAFRTIGRVRFATRDGNGADLKFVHHAVLWVR